MDSQADFQDFGLFLEHFLSDTQGHPKKQMQETRMEMKSQFRKNELWPCPCLPEKRTRELREISLQPRGCMVLLLYPALERESGTVHICGVLPYLQPARRRIWMTQPCLDGGSACSKEATFHRACI